MDYTPVSIVFFNECHDVFRKTIGKSWSNGHFFWALLISPRSIPRLPRFQDGYGALGRAARLLPWNPVSSDPGDLFGSVGSGGDRTQRCRTSEVSRSLEDQGGSWLSGAKSITKNPPFLRHGLPWEIDRTFQWEKPWRNGCWWRFWWSWWMLMGILHQKSVETWGYSAWTEELQGIQLDHGLGWPIVAIPKRPVACYPQVQPPFPIFLLKNPRCLGKKSLPSGYD